MMISSRTTTRSTLSTFSCLWLLFLICGYHNVGVEGKRRIPDFYTSNTKDATNLIDLKFVSRVMVPYGADIYNSDPSSVPQSRDEQPLNGYGFGMVSARSFLLARRD